jgi:hypothetical protein
MNYRFICLRWVQIIRLVFTGTLFICMSGSDGCWMRETFYVFVWRFDHENIVYFYALRQQGGVRGGLGLFL